MAGLSCAFLSNFVRIEGEIPLQLLMTTPGLVPYQPQSFPKIDFHFTRSLLRKGGATEVLSEWLDDFLDIAEVALSDRPQLLEALGVVARS